MSVKNITTEKLNDYRIVIKNGKDLDRYTAIITAFPNAKENDIFGIIACGEDLVVKKY